MCPELTINQAQSGQSFNVRRGTRILLPVKENPTTGYRWSLCRFDCTNVDLESDNYVDPETGGIGGGGTREFRFIARAPGRCRIELQNKRSWEGEGSAKETFEIT